MTMNKNSQLKVVFSGGGTGGSVTPLLAVANELKTISADTEVLFVGTDAGPEKELVTKHNLVNGSWRFIAIPAGKWRRYFSWQNFTDLFKIVKAFFVSVKLLRREKASLVISAGGFVSVPLAYASCFLKIPIIIHQQDIRPGLANRLMAKVATVVTTAFAKSVADYGPKAKHLGNPTPASPSANYQANLRLKYHLSTDKPVLLVSGGGTGALAINDLLYQSVPSLTKTFQVIHLTGVGKGLEPEARKSLLSEKDYQQHEFVSNEEMLALLALADIVVSRCGLATITELCALRKLSVLIPIPNSHQEDNADIFIDTESALVLEQTKLGAESFVEAVLQLWQDKARIDLYQKNIAKVMKTGASQALAQLILDIAKK